MQGGEFLPGVGFRCVGFTAGARAHAVGSVLVALPPVTPHQSIGVTQISTNPSVFFFKKNETKPNLVCGDRFLPLLFPVPQSSRILWGLPRARGAGPLRAPHPKPQAGEDRRHKSLLRQLTAPLLLFWGELSPFRPTSTHPRGPCGAAGVGQLPELLLLFLLLRVFGGEKGILDECFVPAADAVALPVRFGRGSPTAAAPGPWGWR